MNSPEMREGSPRGDLQARSGEPEKILGRKVLRGFSKQRSQSERDALAEDAQNARKSYFARIATIDTKVARLEYTIRQKAIASEIAIRELNTLTEECEVLRTSLFNSFLGFFGLNKREKRLEEGIASQGVTIEELEQTSQRLFAAREALEKERASRNELDAVKKRIADFYAKQHSEAMRVFTEQVRIRDVARIAKDHDVVFVHGLHPSYTPKSNSLLHNLADWQAKLDVFLALQPTVSASTIVRGDGPSALWSRMGVLLTKGIVESVDSGDAATQAQGTKNRSGFYRGELSDAKIRSTIQHRHQRHQKNYNEFVVSNPEIAGLYFCREASTEPDLVPIEEMAEVAEALRLPLYELANGQVFRTKREAGGVVQKGESVSPEALLSETRKIGAKERDLFLENVLETSPFKILTQEGNCLNARAGGIELYLKLMFEELDKTKLANLSCTTPSGLFSYSLDERADILRHVRVPFEKQPIDEETRIRRFAVYEGGARPLQRQHTDRWHEISGTYIRDYFHLKTGSYFNAETFLRAMEKEAAALTQETGQFIPFFKDLPRAQVERIKQSVGAQIAFHLYGFAEAAEHFENHTTAEKARSVAHNLMGKEAYDTVLRRRINAEGFMRCTKEDLELMGAK